MIFKNRFFFSVFPKRRKFKNGKWLNFLKWLRFSLQLIKYFYNFPFDFHFWTLKILILITFFDNQSTRFDFDHTVIHIWTKLKARNALHTFSRLSATSVVQRMKMRELKHSSRKCFSRENVAQHDQLSRDLSYQSSTSVCVYMLRYLFCCIVSIHIVAHTTVHGESII